MQIWIKAVGFFLLIIFTFKNSAALEPPQDDFSTGYNYYTGGGIIVSGPAVIAKKELLKQFSLKAGARVDMVSSASVDVVTQASPYKENRTEYIFGANILHKDTFIGLDYINSSEPDYTSENLSIGLAHDLFDKNLTLDFRLKKGWDQVGKNGDPAFGWKDFNRTAYFVGITQTLTPRWLVQFNYELTADEGFINNPYRNALTLSNAWVPENYPDARTGHAWVAQTSMGFPSLKEDGKGIRTTSLQLTYRYYDDTFGIRSHTGKSVVQHYFLQDWLLGVLYQYYQQKEATFYGDQLPDTQVFKARDKELSRFSDHRIGGSITYTPRGGLWKWMENPFIKFTYSFMIFDYKNYTDLRTGQLFSQESHVVHTSIGFNY